MSNDASSPEAIDSVAKKLPFVSHLLELRDRLLRVVIVISGAFIIIFPFANDLYLFIAAPIMNVLPEGTNMIATGVASPFLTPFKLSLMASVVGTMPFLVFQVWGFIAPGLYQHEKKMVTPLVIASTLLFYTGMAFAFYVVFPLVFAFLTAASPDGVQVAPDIANYLDFVLTLFYAFGFAFQVPIVTIVLVWMGFTTPEKLVQKRPYVVVGAFVLGMFLTPPDVISQTLLAIPMWILFELGVIFSKPFVRNADQRKQERETAKKKELDEEKDYLASQVARANTPTSEPETKPTPQTKNTENEADNAYSNEPSDSFYANAIDPDRYDMINEDELDDAMDAELDAIDEDDSYDANEMIKEPLTTEQKLMQIQDKRAIGDIAGARKLLYEILEGADEDHRHVAKNILKQLDE